MSRREALPDVVNRSINQTLSRTVLTSGLTFLTVLSLYMFGGAGAEGIFVRAGGGHFDRHVFVDCGGGADAGGVAGVARQRGKAAVLPAANAFASVGQEASDARCCTVMVFSSMHWQGIALF